MTLYHTAQTPVAAGAEIIVREGRLSRFLGMAVNLVLIIGGGGGGIALIYLWLNDHLPEDLGGLFAIPVSLFCLAFSLIGCTHLFAALKRANWRLRLQPHLLIFKFRSDLNARLPEPHPVVAAIAIRDIVWMRKTRERVTQYSLSNNKTSYNAVYLDFKLRLREEEMELLREAIDTEIRYKPGAGQPTLFHRYPVRLDGDLLRVQWWRGLRPKIDETVTLLRDRISMEQPLDLTADFSETPTPSQAEKDILELARRGEKMAAISLARRFYGLSLAEAKAFVEDLKGESPS